MRYDNNRAFNNLIIRVSLSHSNSISRVFNFLTLYLGFYIAHLFRLCFIHREKKLWCKMPPKRKMPPKQEAKKSCYICLRSIENDHLLGPLITTKTITAHFLCVLFNPVTPDADDFAAPEKDGGICGLSARYIREQAGRAAKLVRSFSSATFFFFKFTLTLFRRSATFARGTVLTRAVVSTSAPTRR